MKIILNDSNETILFLRENGLKNPIKYPSIAKPSIDRAIELISRFPNLIVFHGLVGKPNVPEILTPNFKYELDAYTTREFLKLTNTDSISIHLGNTKLDLTDQEMLINLENNFKYLVDALQLNETNIKYISLENMESNVSSNILNPEFIRKAVEVTNTYFLLDTAHATIAANILNMNPLDYIKQLPLNKVKDLHFSGTHLYNGTIYSHICCEEHDYTLLEEILPLLPNLETLTLEYGTPLIKTTSKKYNLFTKNLPQVSYNSFNTNAYLEIEHQYKKINQILCK